MEAYEKIPKNQTLPQSMDFAALRKIGLEELQKISTDIWTDHNLHDPGITILEALAYVLTELGLKIDLDAEDLFAFSVDQLQDENSPFFLPQDILVSGPVTVDDFRKLLIDQAEVRNAWLNAANDVEQKYYFNGEALSYTEGEPLIPKGLYEGMVEFRESEVVGDLNSSILTEAHSVNGNDYLVEFAFPQWDDYLQDRDETLSIDTITIEPFTTPDPGDPNNPIYYLRRISDDTEDDYFVSLTVTYGGSAYEDQFGIRLSLSPELLETDRTDIETTIFASLQNTLPDGLVARYNARVAMGKSLIAGIDTKMQAYRNLGEDFTRFRPSRIQEIALYTKINLQPEVDIEDFLVRLFLALDEFLSPAPDSTLLDSLLSEAKSLDEIFEGPLLESGFISKEELAERGQTDVIYLSDIVRIIMGLNAENDSGQKSDIISLESLSISNFINNQRIASSISDCLGLALSEIYKPRISVLKSKVHLFKNGLPIEYDLTSIYDLYQTTRLAQEIAAESLTTDFPELPVGEQLPLENYYSLQYHFPPTYLLGEGMITQNISLARYAQVRQLKAFLFFFEQVIANFLSQLANAHQLFSLDNTQLRSYFYQPLYAVPEIQDMLVAYLNSGLSWGNFQLDTANDYIQNLENYTEESASISAINRRNRFINHLLSRFGESDSSFVPTLREIEAQLSDEDAKKLILEQRRLNQKLAFLKEYPIISRDRAKGYNMRALDLSNQPDVWDSENISGFCQRVCRILGFESIERRTLSDVSAEIGNNTFGEGFYVLEHVLLRPQYMGPTLNSSDRLMGLDLYQEETDIVNDPYSFRLTIIFPSGYARDFSVPGSEAQLPATPEWGERLRNPEFRLFAENTIRKSLPAHLVPHIFWLDTDLVPFKSPSLNHFENQYSNWLTESAQETINETDLITAQRGLTGYLSFLHTQYENLP